MATAVKDIAIDKLVPYARNSRKHSEAQVEKLAALIKRFGFRVPALVNFKTGELIAGHGRVKGAQRAGLKSIPCLDGSDMTIAEQRAFRVADNRMGELSSWDDEVLPGELTALNDLGFAPELLGFTDDDLAKVAVQSSGVQEVEVSELDDRFWISIRGPVKSQAKALQALRKATTGIEGVAVEVGTVQEI